VSVINKGLQKRVYILIFLVSSCLPLRVLLLGFSVLTKPEHFLFEALVFAGFLVLLSCVVVSIFMLVYLPIADSLTLNRCRGLWGGETGDNALDSIALITANQSLGRDSDTSAKRGSISFRTIIKDEAASTSTYEEEMTALPSGFRLLSGSPGSPTSEPS